MSTKHLYLVNAQPGGNKGAEAMLETVVRQLLEASFSDEIEIWIEALTESDVYPGFCDRMGIARNIFLFQPRRISSPYDIRPSKGDVMIDIGGINYV